MQYPLLYRKRIIPNECILLKDDLILSWNSDRIVTKWNALKPKKDLHHGYSCYFLQDGYKISKFYRADDSLLYYYCDIITHEYSADLQKLVITDLLADVIVYPDGSVRVVDLDEIADALDMGLITQSQIKSAMRSLNSLLVHIYNGRLSELTAPVDSLNKRSAD